MTPALAVAPVAGDAPVSASPITIAVVGAEPRARDIARALRSIEGVSVAYVGEATSMETFDAELSRANAEAVAIVPPVADMHVLVRRALMRRLHVFVAGAVALTWKHALALDDMAERRSCLLMFDAIDLGDARWEFARKMTGGDEPMWRPRYIRSLRTGAPDGASIDDLAAYDLAAVLGLAPALPSHVSAIEARTSDESAAGVVSMTLAFASGEAARVEVSVAEAAPRHDVALVCDGRTVVIDNFDVRAPMTIQAAAMRKSDRRRPDGWDETMMERARGPQSDHETRAAEAFVGAVRAGRTNGNAHDIARAALVWETARASITRGGERLPLPANNPLVAPARPTLRLIRGNDDAPETEGERPALRLVAGERARRRGPDPTPPPSAA
jgi:predicted dehydrogenase